jgi:mono/diheme cytochrome c family protein
MKHWAAILTLAFVLAAGLLATVGLVLLRGGISARPEPSAVEATVARRLRHLAIPAAERARPNPTPRTGEVLAEGRAHFADHCASCHGNDGKGRTQLGRSLYPRTPDLTARATQELSDGELFYIIENGVRFTGMPAFGVEGRPDESWHLVHFLRHLPAIAEVELREMERMNPRSPEEWRELQEEDEFLGGSDASATGAPGRHH